jgi:hypothetical protein
MSFFLPEVKIVLDSMAPNKAQGPEGVLVEFYHACWPIIRNDQCLFFMNYPLVVWIFVH